VNGCQTSHILYQNKSFLNDNIFLPLKIIVTSNSEVTNAIIKATNRQTVVNVEAFESVRNFHKQLEAFYTSFEIEHRLYYERRSKQYDNEPKVKKNRIISLSTQIQSFISMFLLEPHSVHRYYGELLKVYREDKKQLFMDNHELFPYYISGYALNLLERFLNLAKIDSRYKKFKYHMLMLYRLKIGGMELPKLDDRKKMIGYCSALQDSLWDHNISLAHFQEATALIDKALKITKFNPYEASRRRNFTEELISSIGLQASANDAKADSRQKGVVVWFDADKGYGFIKVDSGQEIFVHFSAIWGTGHRYLYKDQRVEFVMVSSDRGLQAKDVEILD
jgi:cold shock CspA family protein